MDIKKIFSHKRVINDNAGIRPLYPVDDAAWVWHPDVGIDEAVFLTFEATIDVPDSGDAVIFHLSADQRYELYCDDQRIAKGPDRGWVHHWTFSSYELTLSPGKHIFRCEVWWLGDMAPEALDTYRGGFTFKAEGVYDGVLTTGKGDNWKVRQRLGWHLNSTNITEAYHVIGHYKTIDGAEWNCTNDNWHTPSIVRKPIYDCNTGVVMKGWKLFETLLPDQIDENIAPGKFVALVDREEAEDYAYSRDDLEHTELSEWNLLLHNNVPVTIPANSTQTLIWDLGDYYCGFIEPEFTGGDGASLEWLWSESLFLPQEHNEPKGRKGNRNQVQGKWFRGFGHTFISDGSENQKYRSYWWLAGRFCRVCITTADQPLILDGLTINEVRYPLEDDGSFSCGDKQFDVVRDLGVRAMQMCTHESLMDCPYYEQMMYVGDTRLELLTTYMMTDDVLISQNAIELFDYSRREWGFVTERATCRDNQLSPTFSLIWIWILHDYLYWRGDVSWIAERMAGARSSLEYFKRYINADGLLESLPGWSFIDWVPGSWGNGMPAEAPGGVYSLPNLHYLLALQKISEIESEVGDADLAAYYCRSAEKLGDAIINAFWDSDRSLLRDDIAGTSYSQHAQCLVLLSDILDEKRAESVFAALLKDSDLALASVYFKYYLFEVFAKFNRCDLFVDELSFWTDMDDQGFKTTVESPGVSRSDCHAWGAHPVVHTITSLLGLRSIAPGMKKISIKPQPAGLPFMKGTVPTHLGRIEFDLSFADNECSGSIELPLGMSGEFVFGEKNIQLFGRTEV